MQAPLNRLSGCFLLLFALCVSRGSAQNTYTGVVADSSSGKALPFATLQAGNGAGNTITSINGRFELKASAGTNLRITYIGYRSKVVTLTTQLRLDTIYLSPQEAVLGEVVIRSNEQKIRRIINAAMRHKSQHNPDGYTQHQCRVYYKMSADLLGVENARRDSSDKLKEKQQQMPDSAAKGPDFFSADRHLLFSETYSHRMYQRPQQVYEVVLAARFAGLKKTYFHNVITDVLPFHIYTDYIALNGVNYVHPIASGWGQRYRFQLEDELVVGSDTVFQLRFSPKPGAAFRALSGIVYINSDGYALSHFIATTADEGGNRSLRFEQVYQKVADRWFPQELNYQFTLHHFIAPGATLQWWGHSVIDSVRFNEPFDYTRSKARPIRLHDSIDLHPADDWARFRTDSLSAREQLTYVFMDSFFNKHRLDKVLTATSKLALGRLPVGKLDLDIRRLVVQNAYEGVRPGLGLFTNNAVSRYFSVGGWAGFGLKDKEWKGGASLTVYPNRNKDYWLEGSYSSYYQNPGDVRIHPELDKVALRNWVLQVPDRVKEYRLAAQVRAGYWEISSEGVQQSLNPLYPSLFEHNGKTHNRFSATEASVGIRYAFGETRIPVFDSYLPVQTKYPRVYLRLGRGEVTAESYDATYWRAIAAITFQYKINRWGQDAFRLEGGLLEAEDGKPLPRSLLLAGNGLYRSGLAYYSSSGFLTMRPYAYYNDRYASLLYQHRFDRHFWETKYSKPALTVAYNVALGRLGASSNEANKGLQPLGNGYHESGLLLNSLLRLNIRLTDVYFNAGYFYHWSGPVNLQKNGVAVFSLSTGF